MSLTNLFAKIAGRHQERQLSRKADFKALIKAVADGQGYRMSNPGKTLGCVQKPRNLLSPCKSCGKDALGTDQGGDDGAAWIVG